MSFAEVLDNSKSWHVETADVLDGLRMLPDGCVQCCVTSPPYFGLRQYLFDGASVIRRDLTPEQRQFIEAELQRLGI